MNRSVLCALALVLAGSTPAQWDTLAYAPRDTTRILYDAGFDFREGIYFGFEDFRANRPAVARKDLLTEQDKPVADLRQSNGRLFYKDSSGTRQRIDLDRVWGFCDRDVVYVRIGDDFSRIGLMGSISHLTFDATYRNAGYYDPYYGNTASNVTVQEQRLLDMDTGRFLPVDAGGIYAIIQRDAVLREQFDALPKKDRKSDVGVFRFMRLYNELHPLYFPR